MVPDIQSQNPISRMMALHDAAWQFLEQATSSTRALGATTISRGDLTVNAGGNIVLRDGGDLTLTDSGQIEILDPEGRGHVFRVAGDGGLTTVDRATGRGAYLFGGNLRFYPDVTQAVFARLATADDGYLLLSSPTGIRLASDGDVVANAAGMLFLTGDQIQLNATGPNGIGMYGTPTTSSAANMFLGTVNGQWQIARVTSSRRYKQDVADAPIDAMASLSWRPRVWRDRAEVEAVGEDAPTQIGFIAEEIDEVSPEFVIRDEDGAPNALAYDRMVAGLVATVQMQQRQIAELTERVEQLEADRA